MNRQRQEINKVLIKHGGPSFIQEWFRQPCHDFDGLSPEQMLEEGRGQEVLEKAKGLYKDKDRGNLGTGDP